MFLSVLIFRPEKTLMWRYLCYQMRKQILLLMEDCRLHYAGKHVHLVVFEAVALV